MKKQTKHKIIIAWLLVATLIISNFAGLSFESKAAPVEQNGYMTYTFSDLGFTEGEQKGAQSKAWDIESYDKVAFTGKVAFGKNNVYARLDIGGANGLEIFYSKDQAYFGADSLCFWDYSGSNLVSWISSEEAGFDLSEEIHLTLKFDVVEETKLQLTVEVASGDKSYERVFPYAANAGISKSIGLVAYDGCGMTIESVKPEVVYDTYTFSDLGFREGELHEGQSKAWDIESYDKVAFTGKVAFGKNNVSARIDIGGANGLYIFYSKDQAYFGSDSLCFWDYSGSNLVSWISSEEAGFDLSEEIHLTLKFDVVEETKLQLTVEVVSGDKSYERIFPYAANAGMSKSIDLIAYDGCGMTIESVVIDEKEVTREAAAYNLRGHDHVTEQKYLVTGNASVEKDGEPYVVTNSEITEPGDYIIKTTTTKNAARYTYIQNVALYILGDVDCDGVAGTEADISALSGMVSAHAYKTRTAAEYAADIDNDGKVGAKDFTLLSNVKPESSYPEGLEEYDVYTFSDLGFTEGEQKGAQSKAWNIESYDKVAFTGKVAFGKNNVYARLDIGGANGLEIFYSKDQAYFGADSLCFWDYSGSGLVSWISNEEAGFDLSEEIQLTLMFDVVEETKIQLTVEVASGDKSYEKIFPHAANAGMSKSIGLVAYDGCGMTIESAKPEVVYDTYTFSDLGFVEGEQTGAQSKAWDIESYDKVAFTGKVAFGKNNVSARIDIGGANGLYIFYSKDQAYFGSDSLCFWDYSGSGLVSWISNEAAGFDLSEEIQLTLKFDVVEETKLQLTVEVASGDKSYERVFPYAANAGMSKSIDLIAGDNAMMTIKSVKLETLKTILEKYHVPAQTYDFLGGNDVMPIAGFYGPHADYVTEEVFKLIKESGINLINYTPYDAGAYLNTDTRKALALATKYQLGWFVEDCRLNPQVNAFDGFTVHPNATMLSPEALASLIGEYSYYDAFLGIHIEDEPTYKDASDTGVEYRKLDYYLQTSKQLNSYANITGFINLVAEDAMTVNVYQQGNRVDDLYDEYWAQYTEGAGAQVYSSDDYLFNNGISEDVHWAGGYFRTLGKTRNEALANSTPFWSYVQAGGDFANDTDVPNAWAIPTEAKTYWNVNVALAFGAKGIEWFPLIQSTTMDGTDGSNPADRCGVLLSNGTKSSFYQYVQNANKQIAAVDEVLMKAISTGIVASGGYAQSEAAGNVGSGATTQVKSSHGKLQGVSSTNETYGALVGCFDYRDTEAFYVVNYNVEGTETITLTLNADSDYRCIIDGVETYLTTSGKTISLTLGAGKGALIVLEDRAVAYQAAELAAFVNAEGENVEPDAEPGYLFAGWFTEESCNKDNAITDLAAYEGTAYAKFVADEILGVKAQLNKGAKETDDKATMRFVTSVDSLDYSKVGFKVKKRSSGEVRDKQFTSVYLELSENYDDGTNNKYTPNELFSTTSVYFSAYSIKNIPQEAFGEEYEVTPYWITYDGTTVYGDTQVKSVNMGFGL